MRRRFILPISQLPRINEAQIFLNFLNLIDKRMRRSIISVVSTQHPQGNGDPMRKASKLLMAGVALVGFSFAAPVAASANSSGAQSHPTGCTYGIADAWRTWAICQNGNGGQYRAIANCKDPETGKIMTTEGNWQRARAISYAYCNGASRPSVAGVETKSS